MADEKSNGQTKNNLNTILLYIVLGVMGFVSVTTVSNQMELVKISASQITRPEVEAKLQEIRLEQATIQTGLRSLELELTKLKYAVNQNEKGIK